MQYCRIVSVLLGGLLAAGLCAAPAGAADRADAFTVSAFGGGYVFEGNQFLDDGPTFGLGLGYNFTENWSAEGVASYVDTATNTYPPEEEVDVYALRLDLLYHFRPEQRFVPYLAAGLGGMRLEHEETQSDDDDGQANYGVGFKLFLKDRVALRADVRHILDINIEDNDREHDVFHNLSYTVGLTFLEGGAERQEPLEVNDTDGDGVMDPFDRCPDTKAGVAVDSRGCPRDTDNDGVADTRDRCPGTPAGVEVDERGCSRQVLADEDGDGVPDERDRCPDTPWGEVDEQGCPQDSDGDGVVDYLDQCPESPADAEVDEKGCVPPEPEAEAVEVKIEFPTGSAEVDTRYHEELAEAAIYIESLPRDQEVTIEGHTDSVGSSEYNRQLSQRRAENVRNYLIEIFELDPDRLKARGFGESRPIADNTSQEGRLQNRRVVITSEP